MVHTLSLLACRKQLLLQMLLLGSHGWGDSNCGTIANGFAAGATRKCL